MRLPAFGDLLAPTCASASLPGSRRSTRISTRPPLSLRPCRRAGITRVSLNTSRSPGRSEEHTSELQSLMRISYAVFCLKKKKNENREKTVKHITIKEKQQLP